MSKAATHFIKSDSSSAPTIALIPGGPGLSSQTLRSLTILKSSFNLVFVDPPGTGSAQVDSPALSYSESLFEIGASLERYSGLILLGHSFGGIQAADLVASKMVDAAALICLSTPFSANTWSVVEEQYSKLKTEDLKVAEAKFAHDPTDLNFRRWLAAYGPLYFTAVTSSTGPSIILEDSASHSVFTEVGKNPERHQALLGKLKSLQIPKIMIHGSVDWLVPEFVVRDDAEAGGFKYHSISNSGHFVNLDAPEKIKTILEKALLKGDKYEAHS